MKKALSIFLCYAVGASVSLGGTLATPMTFEREELWGKVPEFGLDDYGSTSSQNSSYWYRYGSGYNGSLIRAYDAGEYPYDGYSPSNPRPEYQTDPASNRGMMEVNVENPLMRTFKPVESDGTSLPLEIPEGGVFIDTLVQFTACSESPDAIPAMAADAANKFTCWLSVPDGSSETNLVVTAGYFDGSALVTANYVTDAAVEAGSWHRFTARIVADATTSVGDPVPCMALYVDGVLVKCAEYSVGSDAAAMDRLFAGNEFYEAKALFPSRQAAGGEYDAGGVYGVATAGVGAIDEIAVTDVNPIAEPVASIEMSVICPAGIDAVIYEITAFEETEPYAVVTNDTATALTTIAVNAGDAVRLVIKPDATHRVTGEPRLTGNVAALSSFGDGEYYFVEGEFASADRLVARVDVAASYFRVDGELFTNFDDALEAALASESATIAMANDVTLSPYSENGQARVRAGQSVILDLAGRTIRGEHFQDEAAIYNQGHLEIIDSVGGGAIEAPGAAIDVVRDNDALENNHVVALLEIGREGMDSFTVRGVIRNTRGSIAIRGGDYLNPSWASETEFYLADYLADTRYSASPFVGGDGQVYFHVANNGSKHIVRFVAEHGTVSPATTNVADGEVCQPAVVDAPGYKFNDWMLGGAAYDFSQPVTADLVLEASQTLEEYSISNDFFPSEFPTRYTVEFAKQTLRQPSRALFTFEGWIDRNTGWGVESIGGDSTFVGTDVLVHGDLDLDSQWTAKPLSWDNSSYMLSESNGTYSGRWPFSISASGGLTNGTKVKIGEIAFCIVNPHLYPKTGERLAVHPHGAAEATVSAARDIPLDPVTMQYVGYGLMANGRPKVSYVFDPGVMVEVGKTNSVYFCTSDGTMTNGFLRFVHTSDPAYSLIGNCDPGDWSPIPRYSEFCPVYEIKGEAVDE